MRNLLQSGNSKLKKDGIYSFSLPAIKTCPMAGQCKTGCYADQGFFKMPSVQKSYQANFELTKKTAQFVDAMRNEIMKKKPKIVRIHASGDFYNRKYFMAWVFIAQCNPSIQFYAYTKMVLQTKLVQQEFLQTNTQWPKNLTIIFSEGGTQDALISTNNDRHARVFPDHETLKSSGYADVTTHDIGAMGPNHKIGLVYHGAKSKKWSTK